MKPKHRKSHPYHPHTQTERALTLAVLTALLSGAAATPAMAKDVEIAKDEVVDAGGEWVDHEACLTYEAGAKETGTNKTNSLSGNTLTILGTVKFSEGANGIVTAAYRFSESRP